MRTANGDRPEHAAVGKLGKATDLVAVQCVGDGDGSAHRDQEEQHQDQGKVVLVLGRAFKQYQTNTRKVRKRQA